MGEHKFGKCPWCEKETLLMFATGSYTERGNDDEIVIWCDYICPTCLDVARKLKVEKND